MFQQFKYKRKIITVRMFDNYHNYQSITQINLLFVGDRNKGMYDSFVQSNLNYFDQANYLAISLVS